MMEIDMYAMNLSREHSRPITEAKLLRSGIIYGNKSALCMKSVSIPRDAGCRMYENSEWLPDDWMTV